MNPEHKAQALLDLIAADRARQCDAMLDDARRRAAALLAEAHAAARKRLREVFASERAHADERLAAARARLQTARRMHEQKRAALLLTRAWRLLPEELLRRWGEDTARAAWVRHVVATGRAVLPPEDWRIEHASQWPSGEQESLARELGFRPEFVPDSAIRAGLRIRARGNVLDGTLDGLLADRAEIGAQLLNRLGGGAP
ncbi:MAG: hypothetical protein HY778_14280 [Betaproteobacteria bacterium]|nr:hypothetical protein [Betaproteobacteria bacterium]